MGKIVRTSVTGVLGGDVVLPCTIPEKSYEVVIFSLLISKFINCNNEIASLHDIKTGFDTKTDYSMVTKIL